MADHEEKGVFEEIDDFQEFKSETWTNPPTKSPEEIAKSWDSKWDTDNWTDEGKIAFKS